MRYSMLVYLTRMGRTLVEAAEYVASTKTNHPIQQELLTSGEQMIRQIRSELERCRKDLKSNLLIEYLDTIERLWRDADGACISVLARFIQVLPQEVRYQVRAIFFTGLSSTWDAMESVYEYMRDDPRFDPVVVLIPILRQIEKDGQTLQDILFHDYLTPLGVPFLGYTQYNLEEDSPDLAFTNQPYEGNTITEFWPKTIAGHTRLIYLPYFLANVVEGTSLNTLCQAPVYRYAWRVACPTEGEYQYYCRHAENGGINGMLTGIPKLDRLSALTRQGTALPKGWERIIGKKVFLWNTWYIMKFTALKWFSEIISWFAQHEDCALIWRPHPMTDAVTKLHHPNEYPKWLNYLLQVKNMPNVVLDQEPTSDAAFYYSDALLSDYSSLLPQYLLMDKPALWIKNDMWKFTGEEFISSEWMEEANSVEDVVTFLNCIRAGEDRNEGLRNQIRTRDLPLADGRCGERVCNELWNALHSEDLGVRINASYRTD